AETTGPPLRTGLLPLRTITIGALALRTLTLRTLAIGAVIARTVPVGPIAVGAMPVRPVIVRSGALRAIAGVLVLAMRPLLAARLVAEVGPRPLALTFL